MNKEVPLLILGAGSIGERHIRNLWSLGYHNLFVFRQRNLPFRDIGAAQVEVITDWEYVTDMQPYAAFICSPTHLHMQQAIDCLQLDMHVFVEKPLSHTLDRIDELKLLVKEKNKLLHVAYMMRFHPHIKKIREYIESKEFGRLLSFHTHWGSYLPNWHPYEDYRESYAAKKESGGGVALTLSHDLDTVNWLVNDPVKDWKSIFNYTAELQIDVESAADFIIAYTNGVSGTVHLNYLEKIPRRKYEFIFEDATLLFDYFTNTLQVITEGSNTNIVDETFDRNMLFTSEIVSFFSMIEKPAELTAYSLRQIKESEVIIKMCTQQ